MSNNPHDQGDELRDGGQERPPERSRATVAASGAMGGWGISAVVHLAAVAVMWVAVFAVPKIDFDPPPLRHNSITPREKEAVKKDLKDQNLDVTIDIQAPTDQNVPSPEVSTVEVPVDKPDQPADHEVGKNNRNDGIAASEHDGLGIDVSIGIGPGSGSGSGPGPGLFCMRTIGARKKMASIPDAATRASETSVEASLRWFLKHQSPDGSWDPEKYFQNCTDGAKCEPGRYNEASGSVGTTTAVTAYSILCFLGAGYDHKTLNKYRVNVRKGIEFIVRQQDKSGSWGRNYEHPIALMALAEAYAMTQDSELLQPCQKGLAHLLSKQNQDASGGRGLGWDYVGPNKRNDASTTGWNVMALKSAMAAGLNAGHGLEGAQTWINKHWQASNHPNVVKAGFASRDAAAMTVKDQSRFAYMWKTGDDDIDLASEAPAAEVKNPQQKGKPIIPLERHSQLAAKASAESHSLECVGLACGIFLGRGLSDPMIESLANTVMANQVPSAGSMKIYYTYYNTLSLFQLGGERWRQWNGKVRDLLVNSQEVTKDCRDGSWDPKTGTVGGVGRTISTAYNTLSLEVYYRYKQMKAH